MELNRWFGMSRMLTQRANCEIIALNGLIYVVRKLFLNIYIIYILFIYPTKKLIFANNFYLM